MAVAARRVIDFERALAVRPRVRTEHFVLHHVPIAPTPDAADLSTGRVAARSQAVDEDLCFGWMLPKRHARRAVTRSLIKRQIRAACARHAPHIDRGEWLVRLRHPFPTEQYPAAASLPLQAAVRNELDRLFGAVKR